MASFTDQISQFNPYVSRLPLIQEMASTTQEKQQKYDQGVQKIQSYVDNMAGMDVVRDVDKQLLQSKLGELGNNLKIVAAGDFSNSQLVNSVGGMAGQLIKDPDIQNAVSSTSNYRKQISRLQKDVDGGTSNPANILNFNKQATPWLNSTKAGEKFNGTYEPNFDIMKFAKEQFDSVKPGKISFDELYETDAQGNYKYNIEKNKKGEITKTSLVVSPYMVKLEKEGRLPEEVKATLNQIFSDPRVTKQLQITGEYNYANVDGENLAKMVYNQRDEKITLYNDKIAELTLQKTLEKNEDGKKLIQTKIDKIQSNLDSVNSSYDKIAQESYKNPDYVRGYIYKERSMDNLQDMYGSVRVSKQAVDSPLYQANFKQFQEANDMKEAAADLAFKYDSLREQSRQKELDRENALRLGAMKGPGGKNKPGTGPDDERKFEFAENSSNIDVIANHEEDKAKAAIDMLTSGQELIWNGFFGNNPKNIQELSKQIALGKTREQGIETILKNTANANKEQYTDFITRWSTKVVDELKTKPGGVPPALGDTYNLFKKKEKTFQSINQEGEDVNSQVAKEVGFDLANIINNVEVKDTPMKFQGKDIMVTKQDFYDLALYAKGNITIGGYADDKIHKENAKSAEARLTSRGKAFLIPTVLDKFASSYFSPSGAIRDFKTTIRQGVELLPFTDDVYLRDSKGYQINEERGDFGKNLKKVYDVIDNEASAKALTRKAELLKNTTFFKEDIKMPILTGDNETDRQTLNDIRRWTIEYGKSEKNLATSDELKGMLNVIKGDLSDISLEAKTVTGPSGKKVLQISGSDLKNNNSGSIMISDDEAKNGLNIDVSGLYESDEVTNVRRTLRKSPIGSTSKLNAEDVSTYTQGASYFQKYEFPRLIGNSNYDVQANIVKANDLYYGYVYVSTSDGVKKVVKALPGDPNLEVVINKMKSIGPEFAQAALK